MITKKVMMKNSTKSSFSNLISYITDKQGKLNRVGEISITNCNSNSLEWATLEIQSTQKLNTRALSDKTYHLIISFPENETPNKEILNAIEHEMCEAIGFGEHQRISVVHHDTDNLHVHVAINKIHPTKLTLHEPYNDYYVRNKVSSLLEDKFNLQKDNHSHKRIYNQTNDMEKMTGIESLTTYIKKIDLSNVKNWNDLHTIFNDNGLVIRPRGNGLIIEDINFGIVVKGSSVGYSKSILEKKFGKYTPNRNKYSYSIPQKKYTKIPLKTKIDTTKLYLTYKQENECHKQLKNNVYKNARSNRDRLIQAALNKAKLKRKLLKLTNHNPFKKYLYKSIHSTLIKDIEHAKKLYQSEILAAKKLKSLSWMEWLKKSAQTGNKEAFAVLRNNNNKDKKDFTKNSLFSDEKAFTEIIPGLKINNVTTNGSVIYSIASSIIIDSGKEISTKITTDKGLEAAILMAKYRYGSNLKLSGNDEFKRKIVETVVNKNISITFDDANLEKYKNSLMEIKNDKQRNRTTRDRKRTKIIRSRRTGATTTTTTTTTATRSSSSLSRIVNIRRITTDPITLRGYNMRNMSKCNMVSIDRRSEMLLSNNANNDMENQRTRNNNSVRRHFSKQRIFGITIPQGYLNSVDKYINERNDKMNKGIDIKHHMRYNEFFGQNESTVDVQYNGMRYVDNNSLALFEIDNKILVIPIIDKKIETQLRKCRKGDAISLSEEGIRIKSIRYTKSKVR